MQTEHNPPPINKNIFNVGFVLLFFLVLVVSNPGKAEFNSYLKSSILKVKSHEGAPSGITMKLVAGPTAWDVGVTTGRDDYYVFSIYEIGVFDDKQKFIGVFGHFIPIGNS